MLPAIFFDALGWIAAGLVGACLVGTAHALWRARAGAKGQAMGMNVEGGMKAKRT
jgi:hypothetical protein